jgi:uncharacterized protein YjbI with pentapeptide repeats
MKQEELQEILDAHGKWIDGEYGGARADLRGANLRRADLRDADLRGANLRRADLRDANLRGANLRRADLRDANLSGADLSGADLRRADLFGADLFGADLRDANLRGADLRRANLRRADLRRADLDFSCWPLWCGGLAVKVCKRIAVQLAYHFCKLDCDDPEYIAARNAILDFANQFHRVGECGKLEKIDIAKAPGAGKQSGT